MTSPDPPKESSVVEPTVRELFDLQGQVAMVTGATGYLGRRLAAALAEAGATVLATSRVAEQAAAVAADLPRPHQQEHRAVSLDYLDEGSIHAAFQQGLETVGPVDVLVNNGHAAGAEDWTSTSYSAFNRQLANASGYFLLARLTRDEAVRRSAVASIIMVGSMYGLVGSYPDAYREIGPASPVAYHALKGGIHQMTRHLAVYWAADGVRVNSLSPGPFPNPETAPAALIGRLETKVPMARMGKPSELKGAVVFLASTASSYMTGQTLVIDGGWTAW
jgi:NAD(P)-dependent dehydrogenase (short-subunit alcohol dehydrogenase family)